MTFNISLCLSFTQTKQLLYGLELCMSSAVPPVLETLGSLQSQLKAEAEKVLEPLAYQASSCESKSVKVRYW